MFILIGKTNTLDITLNTKHIGDRTNRLAKINQLIVEENGKCYHSLYHIKAWK